MFAFIISVAISLWIICMALCGDRAKQRNFDNMEMLTLFYWSIWVTLFAPFAVIYEIFRYGWDNNRRK